MNIRQCIPADRAKAATFLEGLPRKSAAPESGFTLALSLIASQGEQTQGIALCHPVGGTKVHELFIAALPTEPDLLRMLIDKAVTKLHSQGIHKCKVTMLQGGEPQTIWNQSRWTGTTTEPITPAPPANEKPAKPRKKKAAA